MERSEVRHVLIEAVIAVIANEGMDKVTTKAVATRARVNETYIYRVFGDKAGLLRAAFSQLDSELIEAILKYIPVMQMTDIPIDERCRILFCLVWKFIIGEETRCTSFIRYYYSPYFRKYSEQEHKEGYREVVKQMTPAFREGADVWMLLNHILDFLLTSAFKIFLQQLPDTEQTANDLFRIIYAAMEPQLAWSIRSQYEQSSQ